MEKCEEEEDQWETVEWKRKEVRKEMRIIEKRSEEEDQWERCISVVSASVRKRPAPYHTLTPLNSFPGT
ncbi:hypothetical protein Pmani_035587 [Petrolisthes manimaculis]|uniref:Uncharacterized protein n=1 Tax=Petrolisthes manimaculis TaxID=1843537 RepID=A0AAE1NM25_9EUCA|nr:hypothetical protein Pmani_035587 [Petrolisthes manimaculis]